MGSFWFNMYFATYSIFAVHIASRNRPCLYRGCRVRSSLRVGVKIAQIRMYIV